MEVQHKSSYIHMNEFVYKSACATSGTISHVKTSPKWHRLFC